jgi:hypothetical protein
LTNPEADPRFGLGKGYKKGYQIDTQPQKLEAKAEKQAFK